MAKVGLRHARYCKISATEDDTGKDVESYGEVKTFSKAIRANTSVNAAQADLYADDGLAETASEFIDGSLTFEGDDIEPTVEAEVTGVTLTEAGELKNSGDDTAPYLRFGFIVRRYKANKSQYMGLVFTKLKFDPIPDDYETKGQSIVFKTLTMTAKFMANSEGVWRIKSACMDKETEADAWLAANIKPTA